VRVQIPPSAPFIKRYIPDARHLIAATIFQDYLISVGFKALLSG